jgi:hypothetical protein
MSRKHSCLFIVAFAFTFLLIGCERTTISEIVKNPYRFAGQAVTIAGTVTNTEADAPHQGSFELDDGTGRLWVLSTNYQVPKRGEKLAITALVEDAVKLGSNTLPATLQEIKRLGERAQGSD